MKRDHMRVLLVMINAYMYPKFRPSVFRVRFFTALEVYTGGLHTIYVPYYLLLLLGTTPVFSFA